MRPDALGSSFNLGKRSIGSLYSSSLRAVHPDSPWLWRTDWASGRILGAGKGTVFGAWALALAWCAVSAPTLIVVPLALFHYWPALLALGFPAVGIWLVVRAVRITLRLADFGRPVFEMAAVPGVLGRTLQGAIATRLSTLPQSGVHLKLTCMRREVTGTGRGRTIHELILWRDEHTVPPLQILGGPAGARIPVVFDLPAEQPPTTLENPDDRIVWRLDAAASVPGVDYESSFDVPVFRTADSPPAQSQPVEQRGAPLERPARPQVVVRAAAGDGQEFLFPPDRNPGPATFLTIVWVIWSGFFWEGVWTVSSARTSGGVIFVLVFGALGVVIFWQMLRLWFSESRITCQGGTLTVNNSVFGIGVPRSVPYSAVTGIESPIGMQVGGGSGTPFYRIRILRRNQPPLSANFDIRDKLEAEWVVAELRRTTGLA